MLNIYEMYATKTEDLKELQSKNNTWKDTRSKYKNVICNKCGLNKWKWWKPLVRERSFGKYNSASTGISVSVLLEKEFFSSKLFSQTLFKGASDLFDVTYRALPNIAVCICQLGFQIFYLLYHQTMIRFATCGLSTINNYFSNPIKRAQVDIPERFCEFLL